jgi:hypothetical protein
MENEKKYENNIQKVKSIAPKIYNILATNYNLDDGVLYNQKQELNNELIQNYIVNEKVYNEKWVNGLCKAIEGELKQSVIGATFGTAPNYGGYIKLGEINDQIIELHFYISLISNVFSINIAYIREEQTDKLFNEVEKVGYFKRTKRKIDTLVVSPTKGFFDKEFLSIETLINSTFRNAMFLSYVLDSLDIEKLKVTMSGFNNFKGRLGGVFFTKFLPYNYLTNEIPKIIGNKNYRINQLR